MGIRNRQKSKGGSQDGSQILCRVRGKKARRARLFAFAGYAASASAVFSSCSMERICSRSSGLSWWPCTVVAWSTAKFRTSSSVPEIRMEQDFSVGKRRQSITLRFSTIVPPCRNARIIGSPWSGLQSLSGGWDHALAGWPTCGFLHGMVAPPVELRDGRSIPLTFPLIEPAPSARLLHLCGFAFFKLGPGAAVTGHLLTEAI